MTRKFKVIRTQKETAEAILTVTDEDLEGLDTNFPFCLDELSSNIEDYEFTYTDMCLDYDYDYEEIL